MVTSISSFINRHNRAISNTGMVIGVTVAVSALLCISGILSSSYLGYLGGLTSATLIAGGAGTFVVLSAALGARKIKPEFATAKYEIIDDPSSLEGRMPLLFKISNQQKFIDKYEEAISLFEKEKVDGYKNKEDGQEDGQTVLKYAQKRFWNRAIDHINGKIDATTPTVPPPVQKKFVIVD